MCVLNSVGLRLGFTGQGVDARQLAGEFLPERPSITVARAKTLCLLPCQLVDDLKRQI
jgi:hypothetical protein